MKQDLPAVIDVATIHIRKIVATNEYQADLGPLRGVYYGAKGETAREAVGKVLDTFSDFALMELIREERWP